MLQNLLSFNNKENNDGTYFLSNKFVSYNDTYITFFYCCKVEKKNEDILRLNDMCLSSPVSLINAFNTFEEKKVIAYLPFNSIRT